MDVIVMHSKLFNLNINYLERIYKKGGGINHGSLLREVDNSFDFVSTRQKLVEHFHMFSLLLDQ